MEIDDPTPTSSSHTLEEDLTAPLSTHLPGEDYVTYYSFGSVPPAYIKDSEDDLLLQPTLDYDSLQVLPEPYKISTADVFPPFSTYPSHLVAPVTYSTKRMAYPFPMYDADALTELLDLDLPEEGPGVVPDGLIPLQHNHGIYPLSHHHHHLHPPRPSSPACFSCGCSIEDRHIFAVGGKKYHESCLRCSACPTSLAELKSCFERANAIFCKGCYDQAFSAKCAGCDRSISPSDWVRRARINVYHIACFGCNQCKRQLSTGEEFAIQENKLLCKQHYDELVEGDSAISKQKTKRVRTTFTDEQINVLQTHFNIDSNPDGADLERIAQQTGLSKRVTQVWFQNSRARQKKYNVKKPGTGGHGRTDSLPSSSEDALSPRSEMSSEDCLFPHSSTNNMDDANMQHHRMDMMGMGLQAIDYD